MSWEGIDHALNRVRGEADRITLQRTDLDGHVGHRLLREADLVGRTRQRWERADVRVRSLWAVHPLVRDVVERATDLRASGDPDALDELTRLLGGPSVVLPPAEAGPGAAGERITLAEAIARVTADYEEVTEAISAVETAWDALHPRLGELESMWHEICTYADMVGLGEDENEDLRADLFRIGEVIRRDPLSLVVDGRVVTAEMELLRGRLERTRGQLRDALRMRDSYQETVERLRSAVDDVERVVERARRLRTRVVSKVSSPEVRDIPDPVPGLRSAVAELDLLRADGRWRDLGARLGELQGAVHLAADTARDREVGLTRLLECRAELRGRLDSFRALAVRLGLAGVPRLAALHGAAHWELWSVPCDLRAATVALASYRDAFEEVSGIDLPDIGTPSELEEPDGGSEGGVST